MQTPRPEKLSAGMILSPLPVLLLALLLLLPGGSCSTERKLSRIRSGALSAGLDPGKEPELPETVPFSDGGSGRDTLVVEDLDGNQVILMKAVRDEDGELVATDVLDAAVVTARFKRVAERCGRVDIRFLIRVPAEMQDSRWQLRFQPTLAILGDSLALDPVIITGALYRRRQLRGYEQYERFLSRIISDTTRFIDLGQLEVFVRRNLPGLYRFKTDSSFVSDEQFASHYGVTERDAIDHYTSRYLIRKNDRRKARRERMFRRYVKVPILTEGIRLDTVIRNVSDGSFTYEYVQPVHTRPRLKKVDIFLSGQLYEEDRPLYTIPPGEPLTFYISSLSTLAEPRERYLTQVVQRRVLANTACYIAFQSGRDAVQRELPGNGPEIDRIRENLRELEANETFDIDSIVVTATCSPEGSWGSNGRLAQRRSESVSRYFGTYLDSLRRERGFSVDLDGRIYTDSPDIRFLSRSVPENWAGLEALIRHDSLLTAHQKLSCLTILEQESDPDRRDRRLSAETDCYRYLRSDLYPRLRVVRFDFHLARKGMARDTIHTTILDSVYHSGIEALKDRDYELAVSLLAPYEDYNSAVAYCAAGRNASAMEILRGLPPSGNVYYLKAILYSRMGDEKNAAECYLRACTLNRSLVHRGELDPEIAVLIAKYNLTPPPEEEPDLSF